jgi:Aspartyl protease
MAIWRSSRLLLIGSCAMPWLAGAASFGNFEPPPSAITATVTQTPPDSQVLSEIVVQATDPRYVLPTQRDRIGRIWAPVYINGQGPYRLVLDTGANHSGVTAEVARSLGLSLDDARQVLLRGVTGSAAVPTIRTNTFVAGDLHDSDARLPIVTDALGGAEGVLGTDGMQNRRITIDFRHDFINIARSRDEHAPPGYRVIPFETMRGNLLVVAAQLGRVRIKAIIDTGGQVTIANLALRQALARNRVQSRPTSVEGVTTDVQSAEEAATPPLIIPSTDGLGRFVEIRYRDMYFGDMHIFEHWRLINEPAMLVGMDALGLFDVLIIDYRRHELQVRTRSDG